MSQVNFIFSGFNKNLLSLIQQQAQILQNDPSDRQSPLIECKSSGERRHTKYDEPVTALFIKFHLIPPDNHLNNECWEMSLKESTTMAGIRAFIFS